MGKNKTIRVNMNEILYEDLETIPDFCPIFPSKSKEPFNYRRFTTEDGVSYFAKSKTVDPTAPVESYGHIEPLMRYFVYLMRLNGLFVTTGWEGVIDPKMYFEQVKTHERQIQKNGIQIFDFSTGQEYWFKDKSYRAPYNTLEHFLEIEGDSVRHDRIGLLIPYTNLQTIENFRKDPYATGLTKVEEEEILDISDDKFAYFPISIRREDEASRKLEWTQLSAWVLKNLERKADINEGHNSRKPGLR